MIDPQKTILKYAPLAVVLLLAFGLRAYQLDSPLWFDELYGYRLAWLGVDAIFKNSWADPHPPLYYLLQAVLSGFGRIHSTLAWRWLPLVCGVLYVAVVWRILTEVGVNGLTKFVIGLVVASAPALVFYSQEARPFALLQLMTALSVWLTLALVKNPEARWLWIRWVAVSWVGLYTGYAYLMVVGMQSLWLGLHHYRRRAWWLAVGAIGVGALSLWPFATSSLLRVADYYEETKTNPLTLWRTLQTLLAGEALRYSFSVAHMVFPLLALGLLLLAFIRAIRTHDKNLSYLLIQACAPMAVFFVVSPLVSIRLPLPEAKQFLGLLPALWACLACGLLTLQGWLARTPWQGYWATALLGGVMLVLNGLGLWDYWQHPKSPEGVTVLSLQEQAPPDARVVSLHYSVSMALSFHTAGYTVYLQPLPLGESYQYRMTDSEGAVQLPDTITTTQTTAEIRAQGAFWVLAHSSMYREALPELIADCQILLEKEFVARNGTFELMQVTCPPKAE